jgi:Zn-dependent M32 family carboxypeptidase
MKEKLNELKTILAEVEDLRTVSDVLGYDQQTQMPPGRENHVLQDRWRTLHQVP